MSKEDLVREFNDSLRKSRDMATAVAAVTVLTNCIKRSNATTVMELEKELSTAAEKLQRGNPADISVKTACDLFLRYVGRTTDVPDFDALKKILIERGTQFANTSIHARQVIAKHGSRFITRGSTVLVHGVSRAVQCILEKAANLDKELHVIVTEGRPHQDSGKEMAQFLAARGVQCTVVMDTGVAYIMRRVDMVLVGAAGVTENGGVLSRLGTYQVALCAKSLNKPFYVATESYKFSRLYPLHQYDVPRQEQFADIGPLFPTGTKVVNPARDFTPPNLITLLFTDLGILTPAAISDELIQMYSDRDCGLQKWTGN